MGDALTASHGFLAPVSLPLLELPSALAWPTAVANAATTSHLVVCKVIAPTF